MKRFMSLLLVILIAMFLMQGCDKDTSSALNESEQEELELKETVMDEENEYFFDWGFDDGSEENMYDGFSSFSPVGGFPKVLAPINNVVRFGRKINHRFPRTIIIRRLAPDTLQVAVERVFAGQFVIFEKIDYDTTDPDTMAIYRKPLRHIVRRKAIFVRRTPVQSVENPGRGRGRWQLDAISLGQGNSPNTTIRIHQVTVMNSNGDTLMFTNPLQTMIKIPDDMPVYNVGEQVFVQVMLENTTANPFVDPQTGATETVLLHYGTNPHHHARKRFEYVGVNPNTGWHVFEGSWTIRQRPFKVYHAVVDAIDNGTIYDNDPVAYPYNSETWLIPYAVVAAD